MTTALQDLDHLQSVLFVKIDIAEYRLNEGDFPQQEIIQINDSIWDIDLSDGTYLGAGQLLSLTQTISEIRPGDDSLTISLSGVPSDRVREIINSNIKGSEISVSRGFYYPGTKSIISDLDGTNAGIGGRFYGYISSYSIIDDVDRNTLTNTVTIVFECINIIGLEKLLTKGVRTNPRDWNYLYPTDTIMNRVPALEGTTFVFGGAQ